MTELLTTGPIKVGYDDPNTNTRQAHGATATIIATLGEPTATDKDPCTVHQIGNSRSAIYLVAAILATVAKTYGPEAVEIAIKSARTIYDSPSAWKANLRIDSEPTEKEGRL